VSVNRFAVVASTARRLDVLILTAFIWFFGKFLRYVFPPLFESLQVTYTVSTTALGWTFSAFLFAYAAVQFPSGVLSDKFGAVPVITGGIMLSSIAAVSLFATVPFSIFVIVMLVLGLGTGLHKTAAVQLLSKVYPAQTGRVLGVFDTFGTFGGVIAPIAVVVAANWVGSRPGWQIMMLGLGLLGFVFSVSFLIHVPKRLQASETQTESTTASGESGLDDDVERHWKSYFETFYNHQFSVFVAASICFSFAYYGIVSFLPLYLTQEARVSSVSAGTLYSVFFVVSLVQIVSGDLSDRIGTLPVILAALSLSAVSLAGFILTTGGNIFVLAVAVVCIGLGVHSFRPVRAAYLMQILPERIAAGSFGIVRTLLMLSGAVSPGIIGTLSDRVGFRIAFWILTFSMVAAAGLILLLMWRINPASN